VAVKGGLMRSELIAGKDNHWVKSFNVFIPDYAAVLAIVVPKWFFVVPLSLGKIPKISVLEGESSRLRHDITIPFKK